MTHIILNFHHKYAINSQALEQFETHDNSSPQEIAAIIQSRGHESVWKDWDPTLMDNAI